MTPEEKAKYENRAKEEKRRARESGLSVNVSRAADAADDRLDNIGERIAVNLIFQCLRSLIIRHL